ncbi:hypothetical protein Tco_1056077 [Tanacetum coccineum]|uniref:Uncharacterized protein n=1 Tax=Tanacetum coccineum TaxID=301880 RepID=A0ABQ5H2Y8_9ASTR
MICSTTRRLFEPLDLGEIAFGKPFIEETGLAYNKEEGAIVFRRNDEKITFKMPHRMKLNKHLDLKDMQHRSYTTIRPKEDIRMNMGKCTTLIV